MTRTRQERFKSLGRFSEVGFHIMVALAEGPKHGYAMMQEIGGMAGSAPGPGTLYAAIAKLEERQWIAPVASDDRRRPYRLTPSGRQALRARLAALEAVSRTARQRLAHQS